MKTRRLFVVLVVANLVCLAFQFAHGGGAGPADPVAQVVRAKAFELVDDQGRVRAQLRVFPATNSKNPDGTGGYPETVLLRLISSKGAPNVKIAATEDGTACSFAGEDKGYVQIVARGKEQPFVKVVTKDGQERVLK